MSTQSRFRLSGRAKVGIVRTLQVIMLGILLVGVALGNAGVAVNAAIGFLVTLLPAVFERRFGISMSPGLVLWITVAMALHAIGTLPLPGLDFLSPYKAVWWWDHMTHALSSSLVVGAAYAVTRAVQEHTPYINMGPKFTFVYLLVFVMAFGVFWELIEFYIGSCAGCARRSRKSSWGSKTPRGTGRTRQPCWGSKG